MALLKDEPAAPEVEELLRGGVGMAAVNLAEAIDVLGRVDGVPPERLRELIEPLLVGPITVLSVTARQAWRAAELRRRHYHRRSCPLSLADCLLLAACAGEYELATADPDLLAVAALEGLAVRRLTDARGG
ncbi:MAG: ribonuclease VapC [Miltoncostaeaceae bacterium]|nr:ribonuclease VapC [Miltoncostaeaceae bacterium]